MTFLEGGLVLGRGTLLASFAKDARNEGRQGARPLFPGSHEARILSLSAAAYGKPIDERVIEKISRACEFWCAGQKTLAQLHLALIGLPTVDGTGAYRLFLAGKALDKGLNPSALMKALGFPQAANELEKYNQDQPRVPAGSGRESGRWTSARGGSAPRQRFVQRIEIRADRSTMSDAGQTGIVPGAQYAQVSPTPILTPEVLEKIRKDHGSGWTDEEKGRFIGHYATEEGIRELISDAWKNATPDDLAGTYAGRVIIGAASYALVDGKPEPDYVGYSADRTKIKEPSGERGTPSAMTNIYIVILDSNMKVIACYPINPIDLRNPRNFPND